MLGSGRRLGAEAQAGWIPSARSLSGRGRSVGCGRRGASWITIRVLSRRVTGGAWPPSSGFLPVLPDCFPHGRWSDPLHLPKGTREGIELF